MCINMQKIMSSARSIGGAMRLDACVPKSWRGRGTILMLHHVRPWIKRDYAPNHVLEITPDLLDRVIVQIRVLGFDIISLDEACQRLLRPKSALERPFVVFTFDDGYRDNAIYAQPILQRHGAPYTFYVVPGYAERTARLWWYELEEALRLLNEVEVIIEGKSFSFDLRTAQQKQTAFVPIYWALRAAPEEELLAVIATLCQKAGVNGSRLVETLCMDWQEILGVAQDPLCTIGVHSLTHPRFAKYDTAFVQRELAQSRRQIEEKIGKPAVHFAYPVGDVTSAGPRDFRLAQEAGFVSSVTTRPGMVFDVNARHMQALPRIAVTQAWENERAMRMTLSGLTMAIRKRGFQPDIG